MSKSKKPAVTIRNPENAIRALEARAEARQAAPAGAASLKARKPAVVQAGDLAPSRSVTRQRGAWTKAEPYTRKDGTQTRGTTVYLPVELAERLRRYAFEHDRKQSDIIAEALAAWLDGHV